jgi:chemotaxis protein MotB
MSDDHPEIVIVRRRSALEDAHHGGAWKIAFADFMTAMMAFFLVLWIISATDKNTKTLIARYFNPVKVEEPAKAPKGIQGEPGPQTDSRRSSGAFTAEQARSAQPDKTASGTPEIPEAPSRETKGKYDAQPEAVAPPDPSRPHPTMSEEELFSDPRASLAACRTGGCG